MPLTHSDFCKDEHIAVHAIADYWQLCPREGTLAQGIDGAFASGARWSLTSASDFAAQGVAAGNCVLLTKPVATFRAPGTLFAVESVTTTTAVLRRVGLAASIGEPPSPVGGLTGVEFAVLTFAPQIEEAFYQIKKSLGIDDTVGGRKTSDMKDAREIRTAIAYMVLKDQYRRLSRQAGSNNDHFAAQAKLYEMLFDEHMASLRVHWTNTGEPSSVSSLFNARIER